MAKLFHILNGDSLAQSFPKNISGETLIWRECLVDGPLSQAHFFEERERFITNNYSFENANYENLVVSEFNKILEIAEGSEIYFWFGDDLFCQVNFWFLIDTLNQKNVRLYRMFPEKPEIDFGVQTKEELLEVFKKPVFINNEEKILISELWKSFQNGNFHDVKNKNSEIVRNLFELIEAQKQLKNGTVLQFVKEISSQTKKFSKIFKSFRERFPIYGFGDLQMKNLMNNL